MEEIVVVGYGVVERRDLTGSISSLDGEELTEVPSPNPLQALQGELPGVQVSSNTGAPGTAPLIRIRGIGTLNEASPLFVVDGVLLREPSEIQYLNDADIESIEVLKDASATAIYGARGANGVVIITTKRGQQGEPQINLNASYGFQIIQKKIDLLNGPEFAQLTNEIFPNTFPDPNAVPSTDWQDLIFDEPARIIDADLNFSGGSERITYYVGVGYFNQEGVIPSSNFERFSLKLNNRYNLIGNLDVGHNLTFTRYQTGIAPNVVSEAYRARPSSEPFTPEGEFAPVPRSANPLATLAYNDDERTGIQAVGNIFAEWTFLENFTLLSSFGISTDFNRFEAFDAAFILGPEQRNDVNNYSITNTEDVRWFWENTLTYQQAFGIHRINAVVGYTVQAERNTFVQAQTEGLVREGEGQRFIDAGVQDQEQAGGNGQQSSIVSYLFRVNYTLRDRYLITLTGRADASSRFPDDERYGFFPAVGLGWNLSEEAFLTDSDWLSNLRIRGSWGILGNDRIGNETRFPLIARGLDAVFGPDENLAPGATIDRRVNEELTWEETRQWDVGLEFGLWEGRLTGEFDYYNRLSDDILVDLLTPAHFGNGPFVRVVYNLAEVLNRGFEFRLEWQDELEGIGLNYGLSVNGTTVNNEVLALGAGRGANSFIIDGSLGNGQNVSRTQVGQPIGAFYGYEVDGVFQNEQDLSNFAVLSGQGVGDFRFVDQNGDGVIT
ncbi:MAG: SusC/RagA family TonB-linked outer membrane protein, partial [Bacteroidia bacterium]|nr:SusC/RagA family TonB-linked outer membrane protein [Bacteroidia bacterium]